MTPTHKSFTNGRIEAEVVAASLPTLALLVFAPPGNLGACLTVLGLGGSLWVARRCVHMTRLPRSTWPVLVCLAVAAVVRAPMGSQDMWSYAFFGRLVADYGADPYSVVANQHPHDLVVHLVGWRNTPSGYGPLFTLYSAAVAQMAGRSLVLLRLGFQIPAAASVLVCLRYLSTRGKTAAVLLIGLQPMIWLTTVNGGHNDALVALALLGAVVAFSADRTWAAAAAVAVAALIKLSSLLLVVPVCVVLVCRGRRREAFGFGLVSAGPVLLGGLVFPRSLANASRAAVNKVSIASVWRPVRAVVELEPAMLSRLAMVIVVVAVVAVSRRRRNDTTIDAGAGASLSFYSMLSNYTLPWYTIWGLPALALSGDLVLTGLVAARGSLMTVSYQLTGTGPLLSATHWITDLILPPLLAVAFVLFAFRSPRGGADQLGGGHEWRSDASALYDDVS